MYKDISNYKDKIGLIFKNHRIERAFVFGSAAKGQLTDESDIDFLIEKLIFYREYT